MFKAKVYITLKESVLDPQGQAVLGALHNLGHSEVDDVRIGKYIEVTLQAASAEEARTRIDTYCKELLANTVIESYSFEVEQNNN